MLLYHHLAKNNWITTALGVIGTRRGRSLRVHSRALSSYFSHLPYGTCHTRWRGTDRDLFFFFFLSSQRQIFLKINYGADEHDIQQTEFLVLCSSSLLALPPGILHQLSHCQEDALLSSLSHVLLQSWFIIAFKR